MEVLTPIAALPTLPTEVLLTIISHLTGQDLKCLRQCCKRFVSAVGPYLFENIVVVPYRESFERSNSLAEHEMISNHVQSVTYDCRRLAIDDEPKFNDSYARLWSLSNTKHTARASVVNLSEVLVLRRRLQQSFLSMQLMDSTNEEAQLRFLFKSCSRLQRVLIRGRHDNNNNLHSAEPSTFHQHMVQEAQLSQNSYTTYSSRHRVMLTLAALQKSGREISDLQLESIEWLALGPLGQLLPTLKHLRLCLQDATPSDAVIHNAYRQLGQTLNQPPRDKLESLEIWFVPPEMWLDRSQHASFHAISCPAYLFNAKCYYPGLKQLHIGTYWTYEHDLLAFLKRASFSLKSLTFSHVGLVAMREDLLPIVNMNVMVSYPPWTEPPSACWVKVMKFLQSEMSLEHVSFCGTLISKEQKFICRDRESIHQDWANSFDKSSDRAQLRGVLSSVSEQDGGKIVGWTESEDREMHRQFHDHDNCLKSRVERFIINGGECPLDSVAAGVDISEDRREARYKLGNGDYSWDIVSPASPQDHGELFSSHVDQIMSYLTT